MKQFLFLSIMVLISSTQVFATSYCHGDVSVCKKGRQMNKKIDRLSRLTGTQCAGGREACLEFLEDVYDDMMFEQSFQNQRMINTTAEYQQLKTKYNNLQQQVQNTAHTELTQLGYPISCFKIIDYHFCTDVFSKLDHPEDQIHFTLSKAPNNVECTSLRGIYACKEL